MAQKWTIWFIIVGNELNVDWMSFPSHLGKLLSIMRQQVRAWWSEWMADFLCSCRDLNLCISRRADLKLPTSRISNEILLALFYTHSTPAPHHPPVDHQRSSKISRELCTAESSNLIFSFKYCWMIWMGMGNVIDQNSNMYDLHNVNIILRSRRHNLDLRHSRTSVMWALIRPFLRFLPEVYAETTRQLHIPPWRYPVVWPKYQTVVQ